MNKAKENDEKKEERAEVARLLGEALAFPEAGLARWDEAREREADVAAHGPRHFVRRYLALCEKTRRETEEYSDRDEEDWDDDRS